MKHGKKGKLNLPLNKGTNAETMVLYSDIMFCLYTQIGKSMMADDGDEHY